MVLTERTVPKLEAGATPCNRGRNSHTYNNSGSDQRVSIISAATEPNEEPVESVTFCLTLSLLGRVQVNLAFFVDS
jgi:hypothetical protein